MEFGITQQIQKLISLPPRMAERFEELEDRRRPEWYASCDPRDSRLGSGGGTAHLIVSAWRELGGGMSLWEWLRESPKLVLHGGGQSRRLPAYAPIGKLHIPVPVFRWARGHRLDQTLLDLQLPHFERVLEHAPSKYRVMITSGDVLLRFSRILPRFPEADVLGLGMWVSPEVAKDFGVFFSRRTDPEAIEFFLQKPTVARIRQLNTEFLPLVDTGMWLLSEAAVEVLLELCGWDPGRGQFRHEVPEKYDLYGEFGLSLGGNPTHPQAQTQALETKVVALPEAEFYHFGTSRQLIDGVARIQCLEPDESKIGLMGARQYPNQFLQNCRFDFPLNLDRNHSLWIENSIVPASWKVVSEHFLTGVPENDWAMPLEAGVCLDFVPVGDEDLCLRAHHMDDPFRGPVGEEGTAWFGQPAPRWFAVRGIDPMEAGIELTCDIQQAPLFPVLGEGEIDPEFVAWMFQREPGRDEKWAKFWVAAPRLSAQTICEEVNLDRLYARRARNRRAGLPKMLQNNRFSVLYKLDLQATARLYAESDFPLPPEISESAVRLEPMQKVRDQKFRSAVMRLRGESGWERAAANAFAIMRRTIIGSVELKGVRPAKSILEDQIVWSRSPLRLDLAGGWTDTPPYCLENGGRVVNLAVNLNGQPPIQVFAKLSARPELVVRSIDLGTEHRITTYEELATYDQLDRPFPLAKAAFALAGFLPSFLDGPRFDSLEAQLRDFGAGIEISMLSAVPKGSGLGTSSILAASLLAALSDVCGLAWNTDTLFLRTLALEQMLTTGGGWQDQAGGLYRGIKLIETTPGLAQKPTLQWLPEHIFNSDYANQSILLYYTGVTRLAKNILDEIVRGIFLNAADKLRIIDDIGLNAIHTSHAIQRCNYSDVVASVRRSWALNQALDSGTNPPPIQAILDQIHDYLDAAKLLGAGGGGYMIFFAKDEPAAKQIRDSLTNSPPNPAARFVNFDVSQTGLEKTWS